MLCVLQEFRCVHLRKEPGSRSDAHDHGMVLTLYHILRTHPEPHAYVSNVGSQAVLFWSPSSGFNTRWREIPSYPFAANFHATCFLQVSWALLDGSGGGTLWDKAYFCAYLR